MPSKNYYELLEIKRSAGADEIKAAYRRLARKYHPDTAGSDASELLFREITNAYDTLSDPDKRRTYDLKTEFSEKLREKIREYERAQAQARAEQQAQRTNPQSNGKKAALKPNPTEKQTEAQPQAASIKDSISARIKPVYDRVKASVRKVEGLQNSLRGERLYQCTVNQLEALQGCEREIIVEREGKTERLKVRIPSGIRHGIILRVKSGLLGKRLRAQINVEPHPYVELSGDDIIVRVPISLAEAADGAELEVPTLEGSAKVKLPPVQGTPKKLRLNGRGVKTLSTEKMRGDLIIEPVIALPERRSEVFSQAAKAIEEHYDVSVRSQLPKTLKGSK